MAIVFRQTMPEEVPIELLDDVTVEMGVDTNPPAGLIVHTHYNEGGRVRIMDVWESAEAREAFEEERLRPAIEKVSARQGFDIMQMGQPKFEVTEVHRVVRGR
jgi:hypothetical protein